jgi:hypothetical protein
MRCEACHGEGWVTTDIHGRFVALTPDECRESLAVARAIAEVEAMGGNGTVELARRALHANFPIPCPQCGGCGFAHCCEGERPEGAR